MAASVAAQDAREAAEERALTCFPKVENMFCVYTNVSFDLSLEKWRHDIR